MFQNWDPFKLIFIFLIKPVGTDHGHSLSHSRKPLSYHFFITTPPTMEIDSQQEPGSQNLDLPLAVRVARTELAASVEALTQVLQLVAVSQIHPVLPSCTDAAGI